MVPYGDTSSASAMAEARAEFRRGDRRVDVGYWRESLLSCTERDTTRTFVMNPKQSWWI
jgi:hypothetical protein